MFTLLPIWFLTNLESASSESTPKPIQESEQWTFYSLALHLLIPVAGMCLLWGRRDILTRLLLQIDRSCISVCCPSLSKREKLLKWAGENLPRTWSSPLKTLSGGIPDLWKDGSLLCTLINMAVPGACPNPPKHWKKPPTHAQALAYKYLGIVPVFTKTDFEETFSACLEQKFLTYLQDLQNAMKSHCKEEDNMNISSDYLAKGMGLHTGEQHRKATFYIYSNTSSSNCNNILVYIRGPYGTRGTATIPAFHNLNSIPVLNYLHKQFKASDKIVYKKEARKSFLKSIALDFTSFVNLEKKVQANDIPIHVEMEFDRAKIEYIPNNFGIYEINLISNGENLSGSPFLIGVTENLSGIQESFQSAEELLKQVPTIKRKRIISRFIECVDEQILLNNVEDSNNNLRSFRNKIASVSVVSNMDKTSPSPMMPLEQVIEALPHAIIQYEFTSGCEPPKTHHNVLEKITEDDNDTTSETGKTKTNITPNEDKIADQLPENTQLNLIEALKETKSELPQINVKNIYNEVVASIKPFSQNKIEKNQQEPSAIANDKKDEYSNLEIGEKIKHFEANSSLRNINGVISPVIECKNKKTTLSRSYSIDEDASIQVVSPMQFSTSHKVNDDSICSNKPTSIVPPFFKSKLISHEILSGKTDEVIVADQLKVNDETDKKFVDNETEYELKDKKNFSSIIEETENSNENIIEQKINTTRPTGNQTNYIENIKNILLSKMTIDKIINTEKMQDEYYNRNPSYNSLPKSTSPICPAHIAPEVESKRPCQLLPSEKRKQLRKQSCHSLPTSANSSISDKENERVSEKLYDQKYDLQVLSVIDTIKNTSRNRLTKNFSKSVPNISKPKSIEKSSFLPDATAPTDIKNTFQKTKEFWKYKSMDNCSFSSENDIVCRKDVRDEVEKFSMRSTKTPLDFHKSADDILSVSEVKIRTKKLVRYSSLNQKEFQAIKFISIEERKKKLLQDNYYKENLGSRFIKKDIFKKSKTVVVQGIEGELKELKTGEDSKEAILLQEDKCLQRSEKISPNQKDLIEIIPTSQFKRAITFFQSLENSASSNKQLKFTKNPKPSRLKRRFSLDFFDSKKEDKKLGGSLRLPKSTEKFSIAKIYFGIIESTRGGFRKKPGETIMSNRSTVKTKLNIES